MCATACFHDGSPIIDPSKLNVQLFDGSGTGGSIEGAVRGSERAAGGALLDGVFSLAVLGRGGVGRSVFEGRGRAEGGLARPLFGAAQCQRGDLCGLIRRSRGAGLDGKQVLGSMSAMIVWITAVFLIIAIVIGLVVGKRASPEEGIAGPGSEADQDYLLREWGVPLPPGDPALGIRREGVMVYRATPDELQACRDQHDREWHWLGDQETIANAGFSVSGEEMRVEYCAWDRDDGRANVICLGYEAMLVYLIVDPPVVRTDNQETREGSGHE